LAARTSCVQARSALSAVKAAVDAADVGGAQEIEAAHGPVRAAGRVYLEICDMLPVTKARQTAVIARARAASADVRQAAPPAYITPASSVGAAHAADKVANNAAGAAAAATAAAAAAARAAATIAAAAASTAGTGAGAGAGAGAGVRMSDCGPSDDSASSFARELTAARAAEAEATAAVRDAGMAYAASRRAGTTGDRSTVDAAQKAMTSARARRALAEAAFTAAEVAAAAAATTAAADTGSGAGAVARSGGAGAGNGAGDPSGNGDGDGDGGDEGGDDGGDGGDAAAETTALAAQTDEDRAAASEALRIADEADKAEREAARAAVASLNLDELAAAGIQLASCPRCKSLFEVEPRVPTADIAARAARAAKADATGSPIEPACDGIWGKPVTDAEANARAVAHYDAARVRCAHCDTNFCAQCRHMPYHVGFTCAAWQNHRRALSCTSCNRDVTARTVFVDPAWCVDTRAAGVGGPAAAGACPDALTVDPVLQASMGVLATAAAVWDFVERRRIALTPGGAQQPEADLALAYQALADARPSLEFCLPREVAGAADARLLAAHQTFMALRGNSLQEPAERAAWSLLESESGAPFVGEGVGARMLDTETMPLSLAMAILAVSPFGRRRPGVPVPARVQAIYAEFAQHVFDPVGRMRRLTHAVASAPCPPARWSVEECHEVRALVLCFSVASRAAFLRASATRHDMKKLAAKATAMAKANKKVKGGRGRRGWRPRAGAAVGGGQSVDDNAIAQLVDNAAKGFGCDITAEQAVLIDSTVCTDSPYQYFGLPPATQAPCCTPEAVYTAIGTLAVSDDIPIVLIHAIRAAALSIFAQVNTIGYTIARPVTCVVPEPAMAAFTRRALAQEVRVVCRKPACVHSLAARCPDTLSQCLHLCYGRRHELTHPPCLADECVERARRFVAQQRHEVAPEIAPGEAFDSLVKTLVTGVHPNYGNPPLDFMSETGSLDPTRCLLAVRVIEAFWHTAKGRVTPAAGMTSASAATVFGGATRLSPASLRLAAAYTSASRGIPVAPFPGQGAQGDCHLCFTDELSAAPIVQVRCRYTRRMHRITFIRCSRFSQTQISAFFLSFPAGLRPHFPRRVRAAAAARGPFDAQPELCVRRVPDLPRGYRAARLPTQRLQPCAAVWARGAIRSQPSTSLFFPLSLRLFRVCPSNLLYLSLHSACMHFFFQIPLDTENVTAVASANLAANAFACNAKIAGVPEYTGPGSEFLPLYAVSTSDSAAELFSLVTKIQRLRRKVEIIALQRLEVDGFLVRGSHEAPRQRRCPPACMSASRLIFLSFVTCPVCFLLLFF
jgi:hypothetical protein